MNSLKINDRRGWSLIILLFIMASFVAMFPLVTSFTDNRANFTTALERWTQWQKAKEGALQHALTNQQPGSFPPFTYSLPGGNELEVSATTSLVTGTGGTGSSGSTEYQITTFTTINSTDDSGFNQGSDNTWTGIISISGDWSSSLSGLGARKSISVNPDEVNEELSDFAVMVAFEDSEVKEGAAADGSDIRFADKEGNLLEFEKVSFEIKDGKAIGRFYVKLPSVSSKLNTDFFMYYSQKDGAVLPDVSLPWDGSGYRGVWHMTESGNGTTGEFKDSSGKANHATGGNGTAAKTPQKQTDANMGPVQFLDGVDDYVVAEHATSLNLGTQITLSAWVKPAATQVIYNFTNAGAEGREGPTQSRINAAYASTPLEGKVTINTQGIQEFKIPFDNFFRFEVRGAQGGKARNLYSGGRGARIAADLRFNEDDIIKVLVGQEGQSSSVANSGGGGGSYVWMDKGLQIAAGGGGGGGYYREGNNGVIGTDGTDGNKQTSAGDIGKPGKNGNGGNCGGAGWLTNGKGGGTNPTKSFTDYFYGQSGDPLRPLEGGTGGSAGSTYTGEGGFGGGGGGTGQPRVNYGAGGGGGYSGGASHDGNGSGGGGGGSFKSGIHQENFTGANSGHGKVTISPKRMIVGKSFSTYALWLEDDLTIKGYINDQAIQTPAPLTADEWNYVVMTYDGINIKLYVNGEEKVSQALTGAIVSSSEVVDLAKAVKGSVSNIRIAEVARSAAWLKFEYHNMTAADNELTW